MTSAPAAKPRCPHTHRDRGACMADGCGRVFTDPRPRDAPLTWRERQAFERQLFAEAFAIQAEIIQGLTVLALVLCSYDRTRLLPPTVPAAEFGRAGEALWTILAAMGDSAPVQAMADAIRASRVAERVATGALQRTMDELVDFDARCAAGDEAGAVMALRGWLERVKGSGEKVR